MSERAQINVRQGNKVIRIYSRWGIPEEVIPAVQAVAETGLSRPLDIAYEIMRQVPDGSIVAKDYDPEDLSFRYSVNVSSKPWRVRATRMACVVLPKNPDGSLDDSNEALSNPKNHRPAVTRSIRIE